jgi:hypothetical protein
MLANGGSSTLSRARAIRGDDGKAQMGVGRGVSMTREVLRRRQDPAIAGAAHIGRAEPSHETGILSIRSDVDHWVVGVVVDVGDGREGPVDAEGPCFTTGNETGEIRRLL